MEKLRRRSQRVDHTPAVAAHLGWIDTKQSARRWADPAHDVRERTLSAIAKTLAGPSQNGDYDDIPERRVLRV